MGVVIRRLSQRLQFEYEGRRHVVCILSDTASRYFTSGVDWIVGENLNVDRCYACDGPQCPIESSTPEMMKGGESNYAMWYPMGYKYADIGNAFRADARMVPVLVLLDDCLEADRVRRYVPHKEWWGPCYRRMTTLCSMASFAELSGVGLSCRAGEIWGACRRQTWAPSARSSVRFSAGIEI